MKKQKNNKDESFLVLTRTETASSEQKDTGERYLTDLKNKAAKATLQYIHIGTVEFQTQLAVFLKKMDAVVQNLPLKVGEFSIDSVELSLEITAKGSIGLLGTGGEVGGSGGLKFILKRNSTL
jgi:hypothetical protein